MTKVTSPENRTVPRATLRRRVFDAAIALFREKGFEATTVEEIARRALVAKGTVFNFFPTKPAILLAYYEQIDARFADAMAALAPGDPKASLVKFYGEAEAMLRKEGPLIDAVLRESARDPDIGNADSDSGEKDRETMIAFFRDCKAQGTLGEGIEPAVAAHIVTDLWTATVMDWVKRAKRYSLKLRLATKLDAIFKGLAPALALMLVLVAGHARAEMSSMEGLYEDKTGPVAVTRFREFGEGLFYIDYAGGRVGKLMEKDGRVLVGIGLDDPKSDAGELKRMATGLRAEVDGEARSLRSVVLSREPFDVMNGAVKLVGEIERRRDGAPKGTVVVVHGSNDAPRSSYYPWSDYLAARGWAVAVYDKRGSGASTGDWAAGGFDELAQDLRAVAAHARGRLPGKPLGLLGISQAGWVMPLAARDGGFDFIVSLMGPAVTPAEQTMETVAGQLGGYGFTRAETRAALAYYRLDLDVTEGKRPWSAIDAAYKTALASGAQWIVAEPEAADSAARGFLHRIARFDPAPYWAKVHVPVLAMFGAKDAIVPVKPNAALLARQLKANRAAKVVTLASANHVGMIAKTGTFAEYPTLERYDGAYFKTFGDWLDARAE